jgi:RNase P subunit RPR2
MPKARMVKTLSPGWKRRHCSRCGKTRPCLFTTNPYQREMSSKVGDLPLSWYCSSCLAYLHDEV